MMEMEGFQGNLVLVDREAGKITSITLWESEEAIEASEERANSMRSSGDSAIHAGVVSVDRCEAGYFVQPYWCLRPRLLKRLWRRCVWLVPGSCWGIDA